MRRIAILLGYDGTEFCGWQRQPNGRSVQMEVERMVSKLCADVPVNVVAAGRTDAGVHAIGQVAHADVSTRYSDSELLHALRRMSPDDIAVQRVVTVDGQFHARYHAVSREYRYMIDTEPHPFRRRYAWLVGKEWVNPELLYEASQMLLGEHDFTFLSKFNPDTPDPVCSVHEIRWEHSEYGVEFYIRANRFLYGMVRLTVGLLMDISRGKRSASDIGELLSRNNRTGQSPAVPACGLSLLHVRYPDLNFDH